MLRSLRSRSRLLTTVFACSLGLPLLTCGDGGASGSGGRVAATGSTSIFLTDAPSDDFEEIHVTLDAIELIGNGPPVEIFSGYETVDLKDLENFSDLFVHADEVPVGTYHQIRMGVRKIELVDEYDVTRCPPPANGRLDLVPREEFEVRAGRNLVIEIDMDARQSIQMVGTGSGRCRFRPVVRLAIEESLPPEKLARVHGEVSQILDDEHFELCSTVFMAARDDGSGRQGIEGGLGDRHRCMMLELDAETGLFDSNGDPAHAESLAVDDELTVIGRFRIIDLSHDDSDPDWAPEAGAGSDQEADRDSHGHSLSELGSSRESDSEDADRPSASAGEFVLIASVIEQGPAGNFLHLAGEIGSALDAFDEFGFRVDPGQGFGDSSVVTALLQEGTGIFDKAGNRLSASEILPATPATIEGVFGTDAEGSFLKSALLVLDMVGGEPTETSDTLRGEIVSTEPALRRLELAVAEGGPAENCVDVPEEADIFSLREGSEGSVSEPIAFEDLSPGQQADFYGFFTEGTACFTAESVIVSPLECSRSADCPDDQYCARDEIGDCSGRGVCEPNPQACPTVMQSVCACDDRTYTNECLANAAGRSVAHDGPCRDEPGI